MKIYVAHASDFDFKTKLYAPLRNSLLNTQYKFLLPQEGAIEEITRDMIKGCDALIAEVSKPSLGAGIEIGWADAFGVPVIALSEVGSTVSFSIDNAVTERFEYDGAEDLLKKLEIALKRIL